MKKTMLSVFPLLAVLGAILAYAGWFFSLPDEAFSWEGGEQICLVPTPQWIPIFGVIWTTIMLTLLVMYVIKHHRKFATIFGHRAPSKDDWKARALIQPVVDAKLSALAQELSDACAEEERLTKTSVVEKLFSNATAHATAQQIAQEQLVKLKEARATVTKTKDAFWSIHQLADDFYFKVKPSHKDYVVKATKRLKASPSAAVATV